MGQGSPANVRRENWLAGKTQHEKTHPGVVAIPIEVSIPGHSIGAGALSAYMMILCLKWEREASGSQSPITLWEIADSLGCHRVTAKKYITILEIAKMIELRSSTGTSRNGNEYVSNIQIEVTCPAEWEIPESLEDGAYPIRKAIPGEIRQQIFQRDQFRCVVCGSSENLTIDHKKPVSKGGKNDPDNLQTMCRTHNVTKGAQ